VQRVESSFRGLLLSKVTFVETGSAQALSFEN
jgi:hypothetical protein